MFILRTFLHLWYEEQSILFCSYTESGFVYSRVFQTNGLMRTRLNPDASKMIICTTGGYLIIIHNLDLTTMAQDLAGFKVICIRSLFANCLVIFELHYYVLWWVICIVPSLIRRKWWAVLWSRLIWGSRNVKSTCHRHVKFFCPKGVTLPHHVMMYLKFSVYMKSTHNYHIYLKCFYRFKRLSGHYFCF